MSEAQKAALNDPRSIEELGERLFDLKDDIDAREERLKELKAERDMIVQTLLPKKMKAGEDNEVNKISIKGRGTIYLQTEIFTYCKSDDRQAMYDWLIEHERSDMVVPYVHPATLKAFAKESMEEGFETPPMLTISSRREARTRKGK